MTKTEKSRGISRILPILSWLPNYDRSWLKADIIAGLSVWALMVPTSLGYATISGVPVQYGLYAAAVGLIAFALFTTSKQVTQGPSSSTAAVLGAAVLAVASAGSDEAVAVAAAIVFVAGLLFIIMYLLKMGWISEFLSASVLTGFTFGVAINVAAGELFKITGTEKAGSNTWGKLWNWIIELPETSMPTLVVGVSALVLVFAIKIFAPKVPGALVAVVLGIAATAVFNLGDLGVAADRRSAERSAQFCAARLWHDPGQPGHDRGSGGRIAADRVFGDHGRGARLRQQTQLQDRYQPGTAGAGHVQCLFRLIPGHLRQRQPVQEPGQ